MILFHGMATKKYGWEVVLFHKVRDFDDGVSFFDFKLNWDRFEAEHSPKVGIYIELLNFTILEISVVNVNH